MWAGWDLAWLAIPGMVDKGAGWILNISSRGAAPKSGPPYAMHPMVAGQCLYGGTKAMLDRVTTGAAMELYDSNIAVNALAPKAQWRRRMPGTDGWRRSGDIRARRDDG